MSEKCPGENVLAQLTDRWTHSKPAPYTWLTQLQFTVVKQWVAEVEVTQNQTALEIVIILLKVHPLYRHELH